MPILQSEPSVYPPDLLEQVARGECPASRWWVLYSRSRQEKLLMRRLHAQGIPFFTPIVTRRYRSPSGRIRTSHVPLFTNYVFVRGDEPERRAALETNCVSRCMAAPNDAQLTHDLLQIQRLIGAGAALTPERRLMPGMMVRIRSGAFRDFEGTVFRRDGQARLLVAVRFLGQGASVLVDDCQLERIG